MSAHILIAEDDPLISAFVEKGLKARGYSTHVVGHGDDALRLGLGGRFDLLLLDMALPGRSGFEVLNALREGGSSLPVVVLTGRPELKAAVSAFDVAEEDFITKPFRFSDLLARVRARASTERGETVHSVGNDPSSVTVATAGQRQR